MPDASVIIIDDEQGIVRLCQRLLERANYEVDGLTNPSEGIELLREKSFDLLLVDIRMPEMDGFQVIEKAQQIQPDLAVVIMTGFGTLETAIRALRKGADGLILKPFEEGGELVSTIREALKERQHKQEVARLQAIRPLLGITESLFSETRRESLLELILNAICGHLRCNNAGIYYKEPGGKKLQLLSNTGKSLSEEKIGQESGLAGRAAHSNMPLWVNREGPGDSKLQQVIKEQGFGSVLCIPIERHEGCLVFMAGRDQNEASFQIVDLEMFGLLARQADIALENSRLYEDLRDYIHQIEESQRALIQAEKMSAVGRLTASIAHEVNNPLQSVRNCLHLAGRDELDESDQNDYLELAEEELERLMSTVQRMLDFYRPGALDKKPVDINELIDRVLALLDKQLSDNNINVRLDISKDLPFVNVVSNQIQQVFFNLILNAMESMENGGELKIKARKAKDNIEIEFTDSGPGVPEEIRENIFEPFNSSRTEGTGLGLSVSYGILTAHGGNLELISTNGKGASFRVVIPIKEMK